MMTDDSRSEIELIISDVEALLQSSMEHGAKPKCRHLQVILDRQGHTVTCKHCNKVVDPFWYLCLLADEWASRRYQDAAAKEAYAKMRKIEEAAKLRGQIFERPDKVGAAQEAWDSYSAYYGREAAYIYYVRKDWWMGDGKGGEESMSYLRMLIAQRAQHKETTP